MSTPPSPSANPDEWDSGYLADLTLPGLVEVEVETSNDIEKKKAKGGKGATTTYQGPHPASVKITCTMHDLIEGTQDFGKAANLLAALRERRGKALAFSHPMAALFGVKEISIEKIRGKKTGRELVISIDASEFTEESKTKGSATKTEKGLEPRNQVLGPDIPDPPATPAASGAALP